MVLDSIAIVVAGMIATYIAGGGELIASHFWNYLLTFICSLPLFVVGMRIFHTYSGIMRYSSFVDLLRISGALVVGFILNSILLMVVPDSIRCELTTEAIVVMLFISMIEMWTMRILVKYMYDSSFQLNQDSGFHTRSKRGWYLLGKVHAQRPSFTVCRQRILYRRSRSGRQIPAGLQSLFL